MATIITTECINCGACEPECPNNAITQGDPIYVIDPLLCTECVGFHDYEACAAVCPVDCCVTDPKNVETEEVLIARAKSLHPETTFGDSFQSRFRKRNGDQPTAGAAGSEKTVVATEKPVAAPAVLAPMATPVAAPPPKPEATPAAPAIPPPQAAVPPKVAAIPAAPASQPAPVHLKEAAKPKKTFANELPNDFDEVARQFRGGRKLNGVGRLVVALAQPVLGALPHETKGSLEAAVQNPLIFSVAGSTGLNILHNAVLYPVVLMIMAAAIKGPAIIFSQDVNIFVFIGIVLAVVEGIFRLRDGIFHAKPPEEMKFSASIYGVPLALVLQPILAKRTGMVRNLPIPVDGFYSKGFVQKLERERRYGNVYTVEDLGGALLLRLEFPRWIPDIGIANRSQLSDEMPDYDYDLALKNGQLIVRGQCTDERVRKISSSVGAFPPEFTTVIPLQERIVGFAHKFENKLLEVFLLKDQSSRLGVHYR